jgi:hypothetical protein
LPRLGNAFKCDGDFLLIDVICIQEHLGLLASFAGDVFNKLKNSLVPKSADGLVVAT